MKTKMLSLLMLYFGLTSLSACSGNLIPADATDPTKAHVVSLTRVTQRVMRYDCKDKLTSNKIEEVGSPSDLMEIHPTNSSWTYDNIASSQFYNKKTGSGAGLIHRHVKFTIDIDNVLLNMRVKPGINEIRYSFTFSDGVEEEGSRFIDVHYSTEFLPEISEIKPSAEECTPPPN